MTRGSAGSLGGEMCRFQDDQVQITMDPWPDPPDGAKRVGFKTGTDDTWILRILRGEMCRFQVQMTRGSGIHPEAKCVGCGVVNR